MNLDEVPQFGTAELNEIQESLADAKRICELIKPHLEFNPLKYLLVKLFVKVTKISGEITEKTETIIALRDENRVSECNAEIAKMRLLLKKSKKIRNDLLKLLNEDEDIKEL